MAKDIIQIVDVINVYPKGCSPSGNPSNYVVFKNELGERFRGYTATDADCGYGTRNFMGKKCLMTYHFTPKNTIITFMEEVK